MYFSVSIVIIYKKISRNFTLTVKQQEIDEFNLYLD